MARKLRLKKKYRRMLRKFKRFLFLLIIIITIVLFVKSILSKEYIESMSITDTVLHAKIIETDQVLYCILSEDTPALDDDWEEVKNNECTITYKENSNLYLKTDEKIIYSTKNSLFMDTVDSDTIYVPVNGYYKYYRYLVGKSSKIKVLEYDDSIINFDKGIIQGLKEGTTKLTIQVDDKEYNTDIVVTSLISRRNTDGYDYSKSYLTCKKYTEEEASLLDNILKNRINSVGYKTRAAVVEAARFLTLDFPYRINYFYENGRQTTNKVDGEGRYYHVGLYLTESKYSDLTGSTTTKNKGPWGCSLYSYPAKRKIDNGLDCSGFVSWALLNGGFDVKDVGAGWADDADLTDFGEVRKITTDLSISNEIKVGDLLHSEKAGGHIGIIVGIDKDYYYIAQALWFDEIGVIVTKIEKEKLKTEFPHVVLMDKYYEKDGYLTNMW